MKSLKDFEGKDEENESTVQKVLNSYREKITSLQIILKDKEYIIKDKNMQINSFVKNYSQIIDAITKGTYQFGEELDNKDKMLNRLINLRTNKPKFWNF